jgi:hypothetical protein
MAAGSRTSFIEIQEAAAGVKQMHVRASGQVHHAAHHHFWHFNSPASQRRAASPVPDGRGHIRLFDGL